MTYLWLNLIGKYFQYKVIQTNTRRYGASNFPSPVFRIDRKTTVIE